MKQTNHVFSILMLCVLPAITFCQQDFSDDLYHYNKVTYEIGTSAGIMNCFTDLGGNKGSGKTFVKDINFANTEPAASIYLSAAYKYALVLRGEATWGIVKANDNVLKNVKESTLGRYDRNLSFRSAIFELMAAAEIHPRYFKKYNSKDKLPRLSPYVLGGIGYFVFNPQTRYNGKLTDLQPLRTEGQGFAEYPDRKPYKLKQFNFPVGGGFRYKFSSMINISAECVYRILNTDYLDDVSTNYVDRKLFQKYLPGGLAPTAEALYDRQKEINPAYTPVVGEIRGNPKKNDSYFSIMFKVGYIF